jgi:hypothetical protein
MLDLDWNLVPAQAPQPPPNPLSLFAEHLAGEVDVGLGRPEVGMTRTRHERRRRRSSRRGVRDRGVPEVVERPYAIPDLGAMESKPERRSEASDVERRALRRRAGAAARRETELEAPPDGSAGL